ncbi:MAG TPA: DUF1707 and DUF4190 domain-containing protein [Streptosporangiaceae bacterium]|nr:DUF1707 and DUF4190 domain-containing protein [Streptosporangiaceae bacterium]
MTENQSQWPAQYPRYSPPDGTQEPQAGYQVPVAGYQVPTGGYPVPTGGYPVPPGGYPAQQSGYQMRAHASMRASSADRERAVDVLKAGFAEGRLTQDEYNDRMGRAYAARTYGDLAALTTDLPVGPLPAWPVPAYQPPPPSGTNSMAIASMVLGVAEFFTAGLTAVPAVICGHIARRQMKETAQRGDGLATSGLVLGYMAIIFWSVLIAASLVGVAISIAHNGPIIVNGPPGGGP